MARPTSPKRRQPSRAPTSRKRKAKTWDLFISHASEDKKAFVGPLAVALRAFGVQVWYDEFALKLGDSLTRSIDRGLAKSAFGLVVISPAFIRKRWPEYELWGLTAREMSRRRQVILPIWHNVTKKLVLKFSPPLADKRALSTAGRTPVEVAAEIIKVVRPDLFTRVLRRLDFLKLMEATPIQRVAPSTLQPAPIQHKTLPADLVGRIRLVRASLLPVAPHSMPYWLDGFRRDSHPSVEVAIWEHMAAVYWEYSAIMRPKTVKESQAILHVIHALDSEDQETAAELAKSLPDGALEILRNLYDSRLPVYDFDEPPPFPGASTQPRKRPPLLDKEQFPGDVPDDLVRELLTDKKGKRTPDSP